MIVAAGIGSEDGEAEEAADGFGVKTTREELGRETDSKGQLLLRGIRDLINSHSSEIVMPEH